MSESEAAATETEEPTHGDIVIRAVDVKRYYFGEAGNVTKALDGITIDIYRGEYLSIMGPSGSGKTTLFNLIGGIDSPTEGMVFIDEIDVAQLDSYELAWMRCNKIGYIFQTYNLVQYMTALENVTVPMAFAGVPEDEARERGMQLLEMVGLKERWFHRPIEMSGGQQQRVAIARAMANNPQILLCDEPTGNLDLRTGAEIHSIIKRVNVERGVTVICATHDHRLINICDRLMEIRDGTVQRLVKRSELVVETGAIGGEENE